MAKKMGKALIFTAVAGAIAAGGVALYNKYKASTDDFDDDFLDFDDEDDDFDNDDDASSQREYVSIPRESEANDVKSETNTSATDNKAASDYNVNVNIDTSGFSEEKDDTSDDTDEIPSTSAKPVDDTKNI